MSGYTRGAVAGRTSPAPGARRDQGLEANTSACKQITKSQKRAGFSHISRPGQGTLHQQQPRVGPDGTDWVEPRQTGPLGATHRPVLTWQDCTHDLRPYPTASSQARLTTTSTSGSVSGHHTSLRRDGFAVRGEGTRADAALDDALLLQRINFLHRETYLRQALPCR